MNTAIIAGGRGPAELVGRICDAIADHRPETHGRWSTRDALFTRAPDR